MAQITDYASLQANVISWLNRVGDTGLAADVPTMIQMAEASLRRDVRVRKLTNRGTFTITADGDALPDDFGELDSWEHEGPTWYGPIELVGDIEEVKLAYGATEAGTPRYATIKDGQVYYAPEPSGTFATRMSYRRKLTALSGVNTTNWLLDSHPDIYLYATLKEAAPYLQEDGRVAMWADRLERALNELRQDNWAQEWGGGRVRRLRDPIGG